MYHFNNPKLQALFNLHIHYAKIIIKPDKTACNHCIIMKPNSDNCMHHHLHQKETWLTDKRVGLRNGKSQVQDQATSFVQKKQKELNHRR